MAAIGTLKANGDETYTLSLDTLTRNFTLQLVKVEAKRNPEGPDFRIVQGNAEMGAAWKKPHERDMPYLEQMVQGVKAMGLEACMTLGTLSESQAQRLANHRQP